MRAVGALGVVVMLAGCATGPGLAAPPGAVISAPAAVAAPARAASPAPSLPPVPGVRVAPASTKYERAVDAAVARDLEVWLEADVVKRWLHGRERFEEGVRRLALLGARPGVQGVKVADELGYRDGLDDEAAISRFASDTARALRAALPGRRLLADVIAPELGCAPGLPEVEAKSRACRARMRAKYPGLTLAALDRLFASGSLDVVDLSTFLDDEAGYRAWGITREQAQDAAWSEVRRRGWPALVTMQSRKALAHRGDYPSGPRAAQTAELDVKTFVDVPIRHGAAAVDVWTWRQNYRGGVVRLPDRNLRGNALTSALRLRKDRGVRLWTHFTPSSVEVGLEPDLDALSEVFDGVFMAAGIG